MTNKEHFKEEIFEIACVGQVIAFDINSNKLCSCGAIKDCCNCLFYGEEDCDKTITAWCNAEYKEPCPFEKHELVEVSNDGTAWSLRYFSHIDEKEISGKYRAFSWGLNNEVNGTSGWDYCRKYGTLGGLMKGEEK